MTPHIRVLIDWTRTRGRLPSVSFDVSLRGGRILVDLDYFCCYDVHVKIR